METWYVVRTKPRQESIAEDNLRRQSFETYLPRMKEQRRYKGKWRNVVAPLFPRYLFISLEMGIDNISRIRHTRGVIGLVQFGNQLAPVPKNLINSLKDAADQQTGIHVPVSPGFEAGDSVTVLEGPLAGLHGIFKSSKGEERVIILLNILGKTNSVTLNRDHIIQSHTL